MIWSTIDLKTAMELEASNPALAYELELTKEVASIVVRLSSELELTEEEASAISEFVL